MPTSVYMILDIHDRLPKIKATRSKLKIPINPQLIAPIMAIVRAIQSNALLFICKTSILNLHMIEIFIYRCYFVHENRVLYMKLTILNKKIKITLTKILFKSKIFKMNL